MSTTASVRGGTRRPARRHSLLWLVVLLPASIAVAKAADPEPLKETLPLQMTIDVRWDETNGSSRDQGSMRVELSGTLRLAEEASVMDSAAPPGAIVTYSADGVSGSFAYDETITQDRPPRGCPPRMAEYRGSGALQLERVGTAMASGLNIRKLGSLVPPEMLSLVPAAAREMMVDYYDFLAVARKQTVHGRRRGWNDCRFEEDAKEVSPVQLTIRFRIPDDGRMAGGRRWTVDGDSGSPSFTIRISDLPAAMERKPLVPAPGTDGGVTYRVDWTFGEVVPYVRIERRAAGMWLAVVDDPEEVKVGERIELRGTVVPEEKDTGRGRWTVPGKTIQEFVVEGGRGFADWLETPELEARELTFHWWDGADRLEVGYETTSSDGKKLTGSAAFHVAEPDTVLRAIVEGDEFAVAQVSYREVDGTLHEGTELVRVAPSGETIRFCHDPLPAELLPGSTQFVQVVETTGRVTKHHDALAGPCMQISVEGLDGRYPYAPGPETRDNPGVPVSLYDLTIAVENSFTTQLMYRPEIEGAIFVPISEVDWTWIGRASRGSITDDWDTAGSAVNAPPTGRPAQAYLEWDHVSTGQEVWDACP